MSCVACVAWPSPTLFFFFAARWRGLALSPLEMTPPAPWNRIGPLPRASAQWTGAAAVASWPPAASLRRQAGSVSIQPKSTVPCFATRNTGRTTGGWLIRKVSKIQSQLQNDMSSMKRFRISSESESQSAGMESTGAPHALYEYYHIVQRTMIVR